MKLLIGLLLFALASWAALAVSGDAVLVGIDPLWAGESIYHTACTYYDGREFKAVEVTYR